VASVNSCRAESIIRALAICVCLASLFNIASLIHSHFDEKVLLKRVFDENANATLPLHAKIIDLKEAIESNYFSSFKSDDQASTWKIGRPYLRQTATETLRGTPGQCGEFSRLMVKLLRESGIEARRLYVYRDRSTNHVMFEYYDRSREKWIAVNSTQSTAYLESATKAKSSSFKELIEDLPSEKLIYTDFGYLNQRLLSVFGPAVARSIPNAIIWLYDEPLVVRILIGVLLLLFAIAGLVISVKPDLRTLLVHDSTF